MAEVMIDLETYGTRPTSVILAIGAIVFHRHESIAAIDSIKPLFLCISIDSCLEHGCTTDKETIDWWEKQSIEVRKAVFDGGDKLDLETALTQLSEWLKQAKVKRVWCQGLTFDIPILEHAFRQCGIAIPWEYWMTRDTRTIYDVCGHQYKKPPNSNYHHPVHDCYFQIQALQTCFQKLNNASVLIDNMKMLSIVSSPPPTAVIHPSTMPRARLVVIEVQGDTYSLNEPRPCVIEGETFFVKDSLKLRLTNNLKWNKEEKQWTCMAPPQDVIDAVRFGIDVHEQGEKKWIKLDYVVRQNTEEDKKARQVHYQAFTESKEYQRIIGTMPWWWADFFEGVDRTCSRCEAFIFANPISQEHSFGGCPHCGVDHLD